MALAPLCGGAIYAENVDLSIIDSRFYANKVLFKSGSLSESGSEAIKDAEAFGGAGVTFAIEAFTNVEPQRPTLTRASVAEGIEDSVVGDPVADTFLLSSSVSSTNDS